MNYRHPYDEPPAVQARPSLCPRKPAPLKRPLPPPQTAGQMPMVCAGCIFEGCCVQSQAYAGHGQRFCRLVGDPRHTPLADRQLLRDIADWQACQMEWNRLEVIAENSRSSTEEAAAEAGMDRLWNGRWKAIEKAIISTPARTAKGAHAKAMLADDYDGEPPAELLQSIARDRLAGLRS